MDDLVKAIAEGLQTTFDGSTVGSGGDYGAMLGKGPFVIHTFFHQWSEVTFPSIHMQVVNEVPQGAPLECCGGGVQVLTVDFRISVDTKKHGWSIASKLHEALREWFCTLNGTEDLVPADATPIDSIYLTYIEPPETTYLYDGEIFNMHVMTRFNYVRQIAGEIL